jgi:hypothetical protein
MMKRFSRILAAMLAAFAVTASAGAAFAAVTTIGNSSYNDAGVLTIGHELPAPDGPGMSFTEKGGLYKLTSNDVALGAAVLSPDAFGILSHNWTDVLELVVTETAAPGSGDAYVNGGFLTHEDIVYIGREFTNLVSLDLGGAAVGAQSGDIPWLGGLKDAFGEFTDLKSVAFPKGLKVISADALAGVSFDLTEVVFNPELETIGKNAFTDALLSGAKITFTGPAPDIDADAFGTGLAAYNFAVPLRYAPEYAAKLPGANIGTVGVSVEAIAPFDEVASTYAAAPAAKNILVSNDGTLAAQISKIEIRDAVPVMTPAAFVTISSPDVTVPAGGKNGEWQVRPRAGLPAGEYSAKVVVLCDGAAPAYADVTFAVYESSSVVSADASADDIGKFWSKKVEHVAGSDYRVTVTMPYHLAGVSAGSIASVWFTGSLLPANRADFTWEIPAARPDVLVVSFVADRGDIDNINIGALYVKDNSSTLYKQEFSPALRLSDIPGGGSGSGGGCGAGFGAAALLLAGTAAALRRRG